MMNAEEILLAAVEKQTPAERAAYLDGACAEDVALRCQVEGLLKAHEEAWTNASALASREAILRFGLHRRREGLCFRVA